MQFGLIRCACALVVEKEMPFIPKNYDGLYGLCGSRSSCSCDRFFVASSILRNALNVLLIVLLNVPIGKLNHIRCAVMQMQ